MCATITNELFDNSKDKAAKIVAAVNDAKDMGIEILPPDINRSGVGCGVEGKSNIRLGLASIKGVGPKAIQEIMKVKPFTSLEDMYDRVNKTTVNSKVFTHLIAAGALDEFGSDRKAMIKKYHELRESKQLPETITLDKKTKLNLELDRPFTEHDKLEWEKMLIGFYASGHPLDELGLPLWKEVPNGKEVDVAGYVTNIRKTKVKRGRQAGKEMAFVSVDTPEGEMRVTIFPTQWEEVQPKVKKGAVVRVKGKKDGDNQMICNTLTNPRLRGTKNIVISDEEDALDD